MADYSEIMNKETPQSQPYDDKQVKNRSGGYVYQTDKWNQLERFLILGVEGDTYYTSQRKLVWRRVESLDDCLDEDIDKTIETICEVSESYRAPKNGPAIFAMAYCLSSDRPLRARRLVVQNIDRVCRTGSHILQFAKFVDDIRGWGKLAQRAFENWYQNQSVSSLCYQIVKYQERHGWSHQDLLNQAHPTPDSEERDTIYHYLINKDNLDSGDLSFSDPDHDLSQIWATEKANEAQREDEIVHLIQDYDLPRECIPNRFMDSPKVWEALLYNGGRGMPVWALVRNLNKLTKVGVISPMSEGTKQVCKYLTNEDKVKGSGIHPLKILIALNQYKEGGSRLGRMAWKPVQDVVDALDEAFYMAFDNVESSGKKTLIGLDVSWSMRSKASGVPLSCRLTSSALCMMTDHVEPQTHIMAFSDNFIPIDISSNQRLDEVIHRVENTTFGRTDCSLPMQYAKRNNIEVDTFVIYTDHETNTGTVHPQRALEKYRDATGIDARLVTVSMTANEFSIADPSDPLSIDIVGFDTSTPEVISQFSAGKI